jgi:hypothetical protein
MKTTSTDAPAAKTSGAVFSYFPCLTQSWNSAERLLPAADYEFKYDGPVRLLRGIAAALNERAFVTRRGSTWLLESEGLFFSVGTGNAKAGAKA